LQDRERLLEMRRYTEDLGAGFLVIGWPTNVYYSDYFREAIEGLAVEGIPAIHLHGLLGNFSDRPELTIPGDGHPSAKAHRMVGEWLYQTLSGNSRLALGALAA